MCGFCWHVYMYMYIIYLCIHKHIATKIGAWHFCTAAFNSGSFSLTSWGHSLRTSNLVAVLCPIGMGLGGMVQPAGLLCAVDPKKDGFSNYPWIWSGWTSPFVVHQSAHELISRIATIVHNSHQSTWEKTSRMWDSMWHSQKVVLNVLQHNLPVNRCIKCIQCIRRLFAHALCCSWFHRCNCCFATCIWSSIFQYLDPQPMSKLELVADQVSPTK